MAPPSPPARRRPGGRAVVLTALAGVVAGIAVFTVAIRVLGSDSVRGPAEGREFDVGPADQRAAAVARDRTPLLFKDPLAQRDVYVHHLDGREWVAFEARAPGAARRCALAWRVATQDLRDPCSGATYPADGRGLVTYPTRVDEDGRLLVDLRAPREPAPVTTAPAG